MDGYRDLIRQRFPEHTRRTSTTSKPKDNKRPDLETILRNPAYDAEMRETLRNRLRESSLDQAKAQKRCLTGAYFWVPLPTTSHHRVRWVVEAFFDEWRPNSDHVYVWRHVQDSLAHHWGRSFRSVDYCGLPRGRVCRALGQVGRSRRNLPIIYHGGDAPIGADGPDHVRRSFNLPRAAPAIFDEHERLIAGQPEELARVLGFDLGLRGVAASELDWG